MAEITTNFEFKLVTDGDNTKTKTAEEFEIFVNNKIQELDLQYDNYIAFVIDNTTDELSSNKALLIRYKGGETQKFYKSTDTFLKSRSESDKATASDNGLMSANDYALLRNLDQNLNINDTNTVVAANNKILSDIIQVDEDNTKTNSNIIYKFKDKKISTIDEIQTKLNDIDNRLTELLKFFSSGYDNDDDIISNYDSMAEYINSLITNSSSDIISNFINHTHKNRD